MQMIPDGAAAHLHDHPLYQGTASAPFAFGDLL